ncbi:MAG TPA: GIY-YIG nuclease family protein [Streptosporangiaceae bacterium]|nr:GIY-YIG nuclease family protein [Streptosporangiaceae bacterium]
MARVRDLWLDSTGQMTLRHPDRGGNARSCRWLAIWLGADGRECTKVFRRRTDAEQLLTMKNKLRIRSELLASDGDGIDPAGFYVYLLWQVQDDTTPVYVGQSGNILARLGTHLGNTEKRAGIGWVTLIRCTSERAMMRREADLIRKYRPAWNKHIPADPEAV